MPPRPARGQGRGGQKNKRNESPTTANAARKGASRTTPSQGDKTRKTDQNALDDMRRTSAQFGQLSTGDGPPPPAAREEPAAPSAEPADSSSSEDDAPAEPKKIECRRGCGASFGLKQTSKRTAHEKGCKFDTFAPADGDSDKVRALKAELEAHKAKAAEEKRKFHVINWIRQKMGAYMSETEFREKYKKLPRARRSTISARP